MRPAVALSEGTTRDSTPTMMISGADPTGRRIGGAAFGSSGRAEGRRLGTSSVSSHPTTIAAMLSCAPAFSAAAMSAFT